MNATITLGNVLTILTVIAGAVGVYVGIMVRLTKLETKLDPVWMWFLAERGEWRCPIVDCPITTQHKARPRPMA